MKASITVLVAGILVGLVSKRTNGDEFVWDGDCGNYSWSTCCELVPDTWFNNWDVPPVSSNSVCADPSRYPGSNDTAVFPVEYNIGGGRTLTKLVSEQKLIVGSGNSLIALRVIDSASYAGLLETVDGANFGGGRHRIEGELDITEGRILLASNVLMTAHGVTTQRGSIYLRNNATFENLGVLTVPSDTGAHRLDTLSPSNTPGDFGPMCPPGVFENTGTLIVESRYDYSINAFFKNTGFLHAKIGTISFGSTCRPPPRPPAHVYHAGTISADTGARIEYGGGYYTIAGATFIGNGEVEVVGFETVFMVVEPSSAEHLTFKGSPPRIELDAALTITDRLSWESGTLVSAESGGGGLDIAGNATLEIPFTAGRDLEGEVVITNLGTVNWTGGTINHDNKARIVNYGDFFVIGTASFVGEPTETDEEFLLLKFENVGYLQKSGGGSSTFGGVLTINEGTIDVREGTIYFGAPFIDTIPIVGSPAIINKGTISCKADGLVLVVNRCVQEYGFLSLINGAVTILDNLPGYSQTASVETSGGTLEVYGGILGGSGVITANRVIISGGSLVPSGQLVINGELVIHGNGILDFADTNGNGSELIVNGSATLGGTLILSPEFSGGPIGFSKRIYDLDGVANGEFGHVLLADGSPAPVTLFQDRATITSVVEEPRQLLFGNFDELPIGTGPDCAQPLGSLIWSEFCETSPTQLSIVPNASFEPLDDGNSLKLNASTTDNLHLPMFTRYRVDEATDPLVSLSFDIWVSSGIASGGCVYAGGDHDGDGNGVNANSDRGPLLCWRASGIVDATLESQVRRTLLPQYPRGVWQHVRLDIDLSADTFDFSWGSEGDVPQVIAVDVPFRSGMIDHIDRVTVAHFGSLDTSALAAIDNVVLRTGNDCNIDGYQDDQEQLGTGDFDADGDVDVRDYQFFYDCAWNLGRTSLYSEPLCSLACKRSFDSVDDDVLDLADYAAYQRAYTGPIPELTTYRDFHDCLSGPDIGEAFVIPVTLCRRSFDWSSDRTVDLRDFAYYQRTFGGSDD